MVFYIYHITGRKVGCTNNLDRRKRQYEKDEGTIPDMIILEILQDKTVQQVGDIEWEWAKKFGYKRGNHYSQTVANRSITGLKSKQSGLGFHAFSKEERIEIGRRVARLKLGFHGISRDEHSQISKEVGRTKGAFVQQDTCIYCGLKTNLGMLARWHNDNCKFKRNGEDE